MIKFLKNFLIMLMAFMVATVTWQIFTRFILNDPSLYTEEIAGFLLIWIGMLGAAYALSNKSHIGIDILTKNLVGYKKNLSEVLIYTFIIIFSFSVLIIGGARLVFITLSLAQVSPALNIKMGYIYLVVPLTGFIMIIFSFNFILAVFKKDNFLR